MVAESPDGPRGDIDLAPEQRDKYSNLILMCKNHHKVIDDQPGKYTVAHLQDLKREHEERVRAAVGPVIQAQQRAKEAYAAIAEEWAERAGLDAWKAWTYKLMSPGNNGLLKPRAESLDQLREWLLGRIWPRENEALEDAFENFRRVLGDLLYHFHTHSEEREKVWSTHKFYRLLEWNPEKYDALAKEYDHHVELLEDLVLELTRAGNLICDLIREHLDPSFRLVQGALLVDSGPHSDLSYHTHRPEYRGHERGKSPYPGLEAFDAARVTRDEHFGRPLS
jgi:hypothetical protein